MKTNLISLSVLGLCWLGTLSSLCAQKLPQFSLSEMGSTFLIADKEVTDESGWTHYYFKDGQYLLLSIQHAGELPSVRKGDLSVRAGLSPGYGKGAMNLTRADYNEEGIWLVANRYWQISAPNPKLTHPLKVRFYFSPTDLEDLEKAMRGLENQPGGLSQMQVFLLSGGLGIHPLATNTYPAEFIRLPVSSDEVHLGIFQGLSYVEFPIDNLDVGGGLGFHIAAPKPTLTVEGRILDLWGNPLPGLRLRAGKLGETWTDVEGRFRFSSIPRGYSLEITPDAPAFRQTLSVLDLVIFARHLYNYEFIGSPHRQLSADLNGDAQITALDLEWARQIILGNALPAKWRLLPADYSFPNKYNPFAAPLPTSLRIEAVEENLHDLNFIAIAPGDIADEKAYHRDPPITLQPEFLLGSFTTCDAEQELVLPLSVRNFAMLRGFQFTLQWDPQLLHFEGFRNNRLEEGAVFGADTQKAELGLLPICWYEPRDTGLSFYDDERMLELVFRARSAEPFETLVQFTDSPTPIRVFHHDFSEASPLFTSGLLRLSGESSLAVELEDSGGGDCQSPEEGFLQVRASGGQPPYTFRWSNGADTPRAEHLKPGTHTLTVTDASGCSTTARFEIAQPTPLVLEPQAAPPSCPDREDGVLLVKVRGGTPPYEYHWETGATEAALRQIAPGSYALTVIDAQGCRAEGVFRVPPAGAFHPEVAVHPATTDRSADGWIAVRRVGGGKAPYRFDWSHGRSGSEQFQLQEGTYTLTITDATGCSQRFEYTVGATARVAEVGNQSLELQPPPHLSPDAPAFLTIRSEGYGKGKLLIYDQRSKAYLKEKVTIEPGVSRFFFKAPREPGYYLVQLLLENGQIVSTRLKVAALAARPEK